MTMEKPIETKLSAISVPKEVGQSLDMFAELWNRHMKESIGKLLAVCAIKGMKAPENPDDPLEIDCSVIIDPSFTKTISPAMRAWIYRVMEKFWRARAEKDEAEFERENAQKYG